MDHPAHDKLTEAIIGGAYKVRKAKGIGLLEHAYQTFLCRELQLRELAVVSQPSLPASYEGVTVDLAYRPDIIVNETVIVEVKAVSKLLLVHRAQVLTYLRESGLRTGLLLNFNAMPFSEGIRRISL
jgi:GxxExxY protein